MIKSSLYFLKRFIILSKNYLLDRIFSNFVILVITRIIIVMLSDVKQNANYSFEHLIFKFNFCAALNLILPKQADNSVRIGNSHFDVVKLVILFLPFATCTPCILIFSCQNTKNQVTPERELFSHLSHGYDRDFSSFLELHTHYLLALYHHFRRPLVVAITRSLFYLPFPFTLSPLLHR